MLAVVIKDPKVGLSNLNLLLGKSAIWFEPLAQKRSLIRRQQVQYIINTESLFYKNICSFRENMGQNFFFASK